MKTTNTTKRVITVLLILVLAVGVLSGCGSANEMKSEAEQTPTPVEEVKEPENKPEEPESESEELPTPVEETQEPESKPEEPESEPEEPQEILPELTDSWYRIEKVFGADTWSVYFVGEVKNADTNHYWTWVPVKATLFDKDGNELQTASESIDVLEPGKTWAVVGVANCETEPASVEITLDSSSLTASAEAPDDYIPAEDFEVSDIKIGEKEYAGGVGSLTFKIKNLSDRTLDRAKYVILFKKDGKVVSGGGGYAAWELEAGATADVESLIYQVDYDEYELYLNGKE